MILLNEPMIQVLTFFAAHSVEIGMGDENTRTTPPYGTVKYILCDQNLLCYHAILVFSNELQ